MMLSIDDLWVSYNHTPILKGISIELGLNEIVCIIGANGAGKSTLLKAISGVLPSQSGHIYFNNQDITGVSPHRRARLGICQVPEGRHVFTTLSVVDNLLMGAYARARTSQKEIHKDIEHVLEIFPGLKGREKQAGGTLSGGEQQMLAIGRGLISKPKAILLDEPSLGLAPMVVRSIFDTIRDLAKTGIPLLLVEQNAQAALRISDRGYVMESGKIVFQGTVDELSGSEEVKKAYLGSTVFVPPAKQ
jgi:branched-chain amino acid transport system ATP-binding protein